MILWFFTNLRCFKHLLNESKREEKKVCNQHSFHSWLVDVADKWSIISNAERKAIGLVCLLLLVYTTIIKRDCSFVCVWVVCLDLCYSRCLEAIMSVGVSSLTLSCKQGSKIGFSSGNEAATMGLIQNKNNQETICLIQPLLHKLRKGKQTVKVPSKIWVSLQWFYKYSKIELSVSILLSFVSCCVHQSWSFRMNRLPSECLP